MALPLSFMNRGPMEDNMTEVKGFTNQDTAELFEVVAFDTKVLDDFLAYFKKMSKHTKELAKAFAAYLDAIEDDPEAEYANGKIPSEDLIPPLLAEEYILVQKLMLACAKFSNL